jgi:hypothetical protein
MIISGISTSELRDVVAKLNAPALYDGNIVIENLEAKNAKDTRVSVKLGTADSKRHGSRTAASGRHGKYLCWHGFRDVIRAVMAVNPEAVARTRDAVYRGSQGFEDTYPSTGSRNCGSMFQPAYAPELCVGTCAGDFH